MSSWQSAERKLYSFLPLRKYNGSFQALLTSRLEAALSIELNFVGFLS
jgi:hypothetical protein